MYRHFVGTGCAPNIAPLVNTTCVGAAVALAALGFWPILPLSTAALIGVVTAAMLYRRGA